LCETILTPLSIMPVGVSSEAEDERWSSIDKVMVCQIMWYRREGNRLIRRGVTWRERRYRVRT